MRTIFLIVMVVISSCNSEVRKMDQTRYKSMLERQHEFTVTDRKGKKHIVFEVTLKEFKRHEKKGIKLIHPFPEKDFKVYVTKRGKIIVSASDLHALYPSLKVFQDAVNSTPQNSTRASMYGKNPYGADFPNKVDSLISSMLHDFKINPANKTDKEILTALDKIIVKKRTPAFFDEYYLSFIAFTGRMAIRKLGARWVMHLYEDKVTWTPCLKIRGNDISFVEYIMSDVYNLNLKKPLEESYESIAGIAGLDSHLP